MYWTNEYNTRDKDVKRLLVEEEVCIGIFSGVIALILAVGLFL